MGKQGFSRFQEQGLAKHGQGVYQRVETQLCSSDTWGVQGMIPGSIATIEAEEGIHFSFSDTATPLLVEITRLASKQLLEVIKGLLSLPDTAGKLFRIESNIRATDAGRVTVTCDPTDLLRELVATLRAGEGDFSIGKINHLRAS
jgi:hypothetical protein